jgi:hypothetical protein
MHRILLYVICITLYSACSMEPAALTAASTLNSKSKQARMVVKSVYEPVGCDPGALDETCTIQQVDSDDLYWQMEVQYPDNATGSDYQPTSFFRAFLQQVLTDERAITVNIEIPGSTPLEANMNVPLVAFAQANNGPFSNSLSVHPGWVTPWTLGRKLTSTPVTIEGTITDTHADEMIQAVNAVVKAITAAGVGSAAVRVAYSSTSVQDLVTSMANLDAQIQKRRSGSTPLSNPQIIVYPAYLKSIDVAQNGLFDGGDGLLFQIVVKWQRSIFAQPVSSGWLSSKVLQTPDDDPGSIGNTPAPHTFLSVISADPAVSAWKAGTPIPASVCSRIIKLGQEGGLAPVDQVILTLSWLQNQSWDTDISLHDDGDSCTKVIEAAVTSSSFPKGATSVSSLLASIVKPRPTAELAYRSGKSSNDAFLAFRQTLAGAAGSDSRLASSVTISVTQPIKELDDYLSLANTNSKASATIDAEKLQMLLAEPSPKNPLVFRDSKRNCFSYNANAASNEITFQCMGLKRADGTITPLDVVILTDKPAFTDGHVAKIQSIQFSPSEHTQSVTSQ